MASNVKTPSQHLSIAFLRKLQENNYITESGKEYPQEEVDRLINEKLGDKKITTPKPASIKMNEVSEDDFFDILGASPEFHVVHSDDSVLVRAPNGDLVMHMRVVNGKPIYHSAFSKEK